MHFEKMHNIIFFPPNQKKNIFIGSGYPKHRYFLFGLITDEVSHIKIFFECQEQHFDCQK